MPSTSVEGFMRIFLRPESIADTRHNEKISYKISIIYCFLAMLEYGKNGNLCDSDLQPQKVCFPDLVQMNSKLKVSLCPNFAGMIPETSFTIPELS